VRESGDLAILRSEYVNVVAYNASYFAMCYLSKQSKEVPTYISQYKNWDRSSTKIYRKSKSRARTQEPSDV